jgi:hypothetical protein
MFAKIDVVYQAFDDLSLLALACPSADQITVKFPGTVISSATPLHPVDGWPLDPLVCIRRIAAQNDRLMRKASIKIASGHPATYQE